MENSVILFDILMFVIPAAAGVVAGVLGSFSFWRARACVERATFRKKIQRMACEIQRRKSELDPQRAAGVEEIMKYVTECEEKLK